MPMNPAEATGRWRARDQDVLDPLMIPLPVVMFEVLCHRPSQMTFAERDHPVEALFFDRSHEPFGMGIRIGRPIRRLHHADPGVLLGGFFDSIVVSTRSASVLTSVFRSNAASSGSSSPTSI